MVKRVERTEPRPNPKGSLLDIAPVSLTSSRPAGTKVPIQLKIPAELAREFRVYCASRELDLSEAFVLMFDAYKKSVG
jgi:hypothetical protein